MTNRLPLIRKSFHHSKHFYTLPLSTITFMFSSAIDFFRTTISHLESQYNESQQCYSTLKMEQIIHSMPETTLTNLRAIYYIYGKNICTIKASITKRNEIIAHLNIMLMKVNAKKKKNANFEIKFETEEDLVCNFIKIFGTAMFNSDLIRKISNEIWRVYIGAGRKKSSNDNLKQMFIEHLDLYCYGIVPVSASILNYLLHKVVIENNLPWIQQVCSGE